MAKPPPSNSKAATKPPSSPPETEPLLTQENFEKELRALASKAQEETWSKWALSQLSVLLHSGTLLFLAALYANISSLTLSPVFGSIPASIFHAKGVMSACFLGWSANLLLRRNLPIKKPQQLLPLIAAYIPVLQFFLFRFSAKLGARYGPVIVESLTFFPLLFLSVSCTATALEDLEINTSGRVQWLTDAMPGICSYAFFKAVEFFSRGFIYRTMGSSIVHTRLGMQVLLAGVYALFAPSKLLLLALPAVLHTALFNFHVPLPYNTELLNSTMSRNGWTVLERTESLTGYLSVIESHEQRFRLMRCDHSLLGGEWLEETTNGLKEPVYGVFVMLEAVRLVDVETPVRDEDANALVIGLGIGTLPSALIKHGISTTIVEIDPAVHHLASKYFNLPQNHTPVLDDAVAVAADLVAQGKKYDYIVHDVFTGGAEPLELFTVEFLRDLRALLKEDGVVAINYAGDLLLPSAHTTLLTILTAFPTCRAFRESAPPAPPHQSKASSPPSPSSPSSSSTSPSSSSTSPKDSPPPPERDFTNLVIFCTNGGRDGKREISFRQPVQADYLNSMARRVFLKPKWEIDLGDFKREFGIVGEEGRRDEDEGEGQEDQEKGDLEGDEEVDRTKGHGKAEMSLLRRNNTADFSRWQQESALGHWVVMRGVIPDGVWEAW